MGKNVRSIYSPKQHGDCQPAGGIRPRLLGKRADAWRYLAGGRRIRQTKVSRYQKSNNQRYSSHTPIFRSVFFPTTAAMALSGRPAKSQRLPACSRQHNTAPPWRGCVPYPILWGHTIGLSVICCTSFSNLCCKLANKRNSSCIARQMLCSCSVSTSNMPPHSAGRRLAHSGFHTAFVLPSRYCGG